MSKLKLSELPKDVQIAKEDVNIIYTVGELIHEIKVLGEDHSDGYWYTCVPDTWKPDARYMLKRYIEQEYDEMYEDWDQRAWDCLKEEDFDAIQVILENAFKRDNGVMNFFRFDKEVEIDINPDET